MTRINAFMMFFIGFLFIPSFLIAAEGDSLFPSVGRLVFAFVLVMGMIYVCIYIFKRFFLNRGSVGVGSIKHKGSFSLGQKARLSIVEVGNRIFLIGVTEHQVSNIAELDPSELGELSRETKKENFIEHLNIFSSKRSGKKTAIV